MGWRDAPIVQEKAPKATKGTWRDAPIVQKVQMPDGTMLHFPAGMSEAAMIDAIKSLGPGAHAAPPPAPAAPATTIGSWRDAPVVKVAAPAPLPVDEEQSLVDTIMGYGGEALDTGAFVTQELARGVTQILGLPSDLVNASPMLLNLLPGEQGMTPMSPNPPAGSKHLWEMFSAPREAAIEYVENPIRDAIGAEQIQRNKQGNYDLTPDNAFERVAGRVMEEIGAAAVPGLGLVRAGAKMGTAGARAMQEGSGFVQRQVGKAVESAAVDPAKFLSKEALYASSAGAGAGLAREAVSDGDAKTTTGTEALADLFGAFGGVGSVALADATQRTLRDGASAITGRGSSTLVRDAVAGELGRSADVPITPSGALDTEALATSLSGGGNASRAVPGFQESTADVAQNPGLASLEYSRQSGSNAGTFTQRRQANQRATNEAIESLAPDATPGTFRETLSARRDDALSGAENKQYVAQQEFDEAAMDLAAAQTGEARGQTIRVALDDALAKAKVVEREAWAGIDGEVDPSGLKAAFEEVTESLTLAERQVVSGDSGTLSIPSRLSKDVAVDEDAALIAQVFGGEAAEEAPELARLAEITTLRGSLTDKARAARSAGDNNAARVLDKYVARIDDFLDGAAPEIVQQMEEARAVTRNLNDRFTRPGTPVAETLSRNQGQPRTPESQVAPKFVQSDEGQASGIDTLLRETNNAPDVRAALEDQIRAGAEPLLDNPARLEKFLGQYEQVFQKFPELRDEFGTAAALKRNLDETTKARKGIERDLGTPEQPGRGAVGKYLQFGDERAVDAMSGVVNAKDPAAAVDELLSFTGGEPKAIEGAKSAFWQLMRRDATSTAITTRSPDGELAWRPQSLYNFLQDPKKRTVAERLYANDPKQLQRVDEIAKALLEVDTRVTAKAPNSSGTPQALAKSEVLPSTETIGAYVFAYKRGQVGLPFIGLRLVSTIARRAALRGKTREFQELLDEALLNPKVAEALLKEHNPASVAAMTRTAKTWMGNRANAVAGLLEDDPTEDEELQNLIMDNH
jgi:hypothetical protein